MSKKLKIGKVILSEKTCTLVAEAGVNHNGSLKIAEKLIREAKKNGADIIKFQTYKAEKLVVKKSSRFWKWTGEIKKKGTQYDSYKKLDVFNKREYSQLIRLCKKYKIEFMSTPFDEDAVDMLYDLGVNGYKVASCDINNYPLLKKIAKKKLPILLSTGASNITEIKQAVNLIKRSGNNKICIMHCTLCYPTKPKDSNLSAIIDLKKIFPKNLIGFSDHTLGVDISSSSVLFGARVIEKHFTINKKLKKSADHWLSITPHELKKLRKNTINLMDSIGYYKKKVLRCELKTRLLARRSLVARRSIQKGEKITLNNIIGKRPGNGIPPNQYKKLIGKIALKDIPTDEKISLKYLK